MKNQKNKKKSKLTEEKGAKEKAQEIKIVRDFTQRNPTEMQNKKSSYIHREPVLKKENALQSIAR